MTASREFNFEAFAAKFDASLLKLLTAEVLTTKRRPPIPQLHWHQQKNIRRDLNKRIGAVYSSHDKLKRVGHWPTCSQETSHKIHNALRKTGTKSSDSYNLKQVLHLYGVRM